MKPQHDVAGQQKTRVTHHDQSKGDATPQHRDGRYELTDDNRAAIRDAVYALPPMTDEQIDAIAEVIVAARERRRHALPPEQ